MARMVEISGQIDNGIWDYSQLDLNGAVVPQVHIERFASRTQHGFDAHRIDMSTLTATYFETSAHLFADGPTIDQIPLEEFIRPAKVMRLPRAGRRTLIRADDLRRHDPGLQPGDALLIDTGWYSHWNQPDFIRDCPCFAASAMEWFSEQKFSILGVDTPVIECHWAAEEGVTTEAGELLVPLYKQGMWLLAPLVNLDQIQQTEGTLIAFPLNIVGVCGTPCRAVFVEGVRWG